jgi:hypothetical protein
MEAHPGPGPMEVYLGAVEAHPGALQGYLRALHAHSTWRLILDKSRLTLETSRLTLDPCTLNLGHGSSRRSREDPPWRHEMLTWSLASHPGVLNDQHRGAIGSP